MSVETLKGRAIANPTVSAYRARKILNKVGFYLLIAVILVYIMFPFYWAVVSSLKPDTELYQTPLSYWPDKLSPGHFDLGGAFDNYSKVLSNSLFLDSLLNSAIVAASVTIISLVLGSLSAYSLGRFRFKGRTAVLYIILSMTLFPTIAVLGGLFQIISAFPTVLYDHLLSLIITYLIFTLPFTVWVLRSFFQSIPFEIEEAAYVDGATPLQIYYRVMLPLALPGLATTGLLAFIQAWNELLFALSFIITPEHQTVPLAITNFKPNGGQGFAVDWGQIMAATVVVTIPLVLLALIFQRWILAGLTSGGVKG